MLTNNDILKLTRVTASLLANKQHKMKNATYQIGEANPDKEISKIACECCQEAWKLIQNENPKYQDVHLVCNCPDINLEFTYANGKIENKKIELKTCKQKNLTLGSCIGKLDTNMPLIYVWRLKNADFEVKWSQYGTAMNMKEYDTFNDRTPRPGLLFDNMYSVNNTEIEHTITPLKDNWWIPHYAKSAIKRLLDNKYDTWQDKMMTLIKEYIIKEFVGQISVEEFQRLKNEQLTSL